MRLIDADALYEWRRWSAVLTERSAFKHDIADAPSIVEFEGDINKVIVKGEEYHKQLTTMWLNPYSPYTCEKCGFHVDSKTRYCPDCGRRADNYD